MQVLKNSLNLMLCSDLAIKTVPSQRCTQRRKEESNAIVVEKAEEEVRNLDGVMTATEAEECDF